MSLVVKEKAATPATPASGYATLYPKSDGWYVLDSAGNEWPVSVVRAVKTITSADSPYSALATDGTVFIDASAAAVTVNLPAGATARKEPYSFKAIDATFAITLDPSGAETIDGAATKTLAAFEAVTIQWNGTEWSIL